MAKWVRMDPETLDEVDTAMVHFWAEEGDGTLWSLNCLIYAGAGVMMKRGKGVCIMHPSRGAFLWAITFLSGDFCLQPSYGS